MIELCPRVRKMHNVIHSPQISRNLISVSQLAAQNNICVEFDATSFFVKDKNIRKDLLQGKLKDGLYQTEPPIKFLQPQAFVVTNTKSSEVLLDWHRKLGHPSQKILFQVLKSCN